MVIKCVKFDSVPWKGSSERSVNEHLHAYRDTRRMNVEWKTWKNGKLTIIIGKKEQTNDSDNAEEEPGQLTELKKKNKQNAYKK